MADESAMNYGRFLTNVSLARKPNPIRLLTALLARSGPSMISLAGGNPNPALFPFQEAKFKLRDGTVLKLSEDRLKVALQYNATQGVVDLVAFIRKMQKHLHDPPLFDASADKGGFEICITPGSQDAICKSIEMLVAPGDTVLTEEPTFSGTLAVVRPLGAKLIGVETDHQGLVPSALRAALSPFQPQRRRAENSSAPKFLYTIPNGCNPTGASSTLERKREIYQIARDYDLLILEDDPYYFLQYSKPRVPSYLSMDVDGRVLRFDSFSKIMSSGLRLGFVSGPKPLVERVNLHVMCSSMHASTFSQVMVLDLLTRWDIEGLELHVSHVVEFYRKQKDVMIAAANKWLTGLAEWNEPSAGMFLWFKLLGIPDTKKLIEEKAQSKEVLLVPGYAFMLNSDQPTQFVRASFSIASPEQINVGLQRLSELIKDELKK